MLEIGADPQVVGVIARRENLAVGLAVKGAIERAIGTGQDRADGAFGDLFGGPPIGAVDRSAQAQRAVANLLRIFGKAGIVAEPLGIIPFAIVALDFGGEQEIAIAELEGATGNKPIEIIAAGLERDKGLQGIDGCRLGGAGKREIPDIGAIGSLAIVDPRDGFGDHRIEIEIALAMGMGSHVQRHIIERQREISAVIKVEAAQEILIGLAAAGVLGRDEPRHCLEQFANAQDGTNREVSAGDTPFGGLGGDADALLAAAKDHNFGRFIERRHQDRLRGWLGGKGFTCHAKQSEGQRQAIACHSH